MINDPASAKTADHAKSPAWKAIVARYQKPAVWRAIWQLLNTLLPYAGLWYLMYLSLAVSWWLVVPLAILAGGFMVRVFIISHDCGHGSFFKSRTANDIWGFITGVLTFTPYHHWRWEHALHHSTSGDLDRRGMGDIWTLTVQEYLESSRWRRFELGFRPEKLPAASGDGEHHRGLCGSVVVLCAAPIRGGLLGAARAMG